MLSKLFESLYLKVFVNIVISRTQTSVYIEISNKKGVLNHAEEVFDTTTINDKMQAFINSYTQETPFNYISLLDTSEFQGAAPTCSAKDFSKFFDADSSKYLCYLNKWAAYTSKSDLQLVKKEYSKIGLDFIFSPFTILARFFKDKIDKTAAMYILVEDGCVSLAVFNDTELLYADYKRFKHAEAAEYSLEDDASSDDDTLNFNGSIDLDNMDTDINMGELDDFADIGDIEDLDMLEDMDDFSEIKDKHVEELTTEKNTGAEMSDTETFGEDYERFLLIQSSVNHFYKDDKFESIFIEKVFIADGIDSGSELKKYLEEEMFLSVIVRRIDLSAELCDLAKAELK